MSDKLTLEELDDLVEHATPVSELGYYKLDIHPESPLGLMIARDPEADEHYFKHCGAEMRAWRVEGNLWDFEPLDGWE